MRSQLIELYMTYQAPIWRGWGPLLLTGDAAAPGIALRAYQFVL
jgi:hypothetical protein